MKRIKEKPKMGKPKEKPKSAGMPKQAARMMKEKYIRKLERRPNGTEGESSYAADQVEQSGRWAAGELAGTVYDRATRQGRELARKQADAPTGEPQIVPETLPNAEALAGGSPAEPAGRWDGPPDTPREQGAKRPINPLKERQTVEQRTTPAADGKRITPRRSVPSTEAKQAQTHRTVNPPKQRPTTQADVPWPTAKPTGHSTAVPGKAPRNAPSPIKEASSSPLGKSPLSSQRHSPGEIQRPPANTIPHVSRSVSVQTAPSDIASVSYPSGKRPSVSAKGQRAIKQRPKFSLSKRNAAASPGIGGKKALTPKVRQGTFKPAVKSVTRPAAPTARAAKAAQRRMQRQMLKQTKQAAKGAGAVFKKLTQAVVKTVHAMISAVMGLVGGAVLLMALVIVIVIAAVANSPFGLFFAQETNTAGAVSVAQAVGSVNMAYPVFVKPLRAGSSYGITKVKGRDELPAAIKLAFEYDSHIVLEEAISGFEVGCAVLGNDTLTVGELDEIELADGFFNFTEKYTLKTSAIHVPARIPTAKAAEMKETAQRIYKALGCQGFARVDMFLDEGGRIVFNEVNTIPGFTAHSRYPSMMKAIGMSFEQVISNVIELAVSK